MWKENAEWGPGGGCCRKMVPIQAGNAQEADGHAQVGTSRTSSASSTSSSGTASNASSSATATSADNGSASNGGGSGSGSGSGCCGSHA